MIVQRDLANARDNMLYLFGRELEVVPPLEVVHGDDGLIQEDDLLQA